jgi:hypothetical protein
LPLEERFDAITAYQLALTDEREANAKFLATLRESIAAGRLEFADAAQRFSDGPSKLQGGLLPLVRPGDLSPQLDAAIFSARAGELSEVIRLAEAAALVLVEDIRPEGPAPLADALKDARETARLKAVEFLYNRELRDVSPWTIAADGRALSRVDWDWPVIKGLGFELSKADMVALFPRTRKPRPVLPQRRRGQSAGQRHWRGRLHPRDGRRGGPGGASLCPARLGAGRNARLRQARLGRASRRPDAPLQR